MVAIHHVEAHVMQAAALGDSAVLWVAVGLFQSVAHEHRVRHSFAG
jgi:hypothetical protein